MQALFGAIVFAVAVLLFVDRRPSRRSRPLLRRVPMSSRTGDLAAVSIFGLSVAISVLGMIPHLRAGLFAYCAACPVAGPGGTTISSFAGFATVVFEACWYYTATVIPVFLAASLLSGLLSTRWSKLTPRNAPTAFLVAAALPVCSCGVIPVAKAMMPTRRAGVRTALVFLATAPLLSPVIIVIGLDVLGPAYVLIRIAGAAVIASLVAVAVAPLVSEPGTAAPPTADQPIACRPPRDNTRSSCDSPVDACPAGSPLTAARATARGLIPYVLYGLCLGSLVAAAVTPEHIQAIARSGILSLAATTLVGIPINMCAGEEVLLVAPLVGGGLPLGHALAFSLASTGICAGSVPLLASVLGRRATAVMIAVYVVVPFALGLLVDTLPLAQFITP